MHDRDAAARLMDEVRRLYREVTGERFTKVGLSDLSGIGRPTLDNWLEVGVMPPVEGMTRLGHALGVPAAHLWMRWLDLGMTRSPLERIADALERAYPPVTPEDAALLSDAALSGVAEGLRRDHARPQHEGPDTHARSPERPPRGTGAGRG